MSDAWQKQSESAWWLDHLSERTVLIVLGTCFFILMFYCILCYWTHPIYWVFWSSQQVTPSCICFNWILFLQLTCSIFVKQCDCICLVLCLSSAVSPHGIKSVELLQALKQSCPGRCYHYFQGVFTHMCVRVCVCLCVCAFECALTQS